MLNFTSRNPIARLIAFACLVVTAAPVFGQDKNVVTKETNPIDHTIKSISFTAGSGLSQNDPQGVFANYLGVRDAQISFVHQHTTHAKSGINSSRYEQYYKGVKVAYASATLCGRDNGVSYVNANYYLPTTDLSTVPTLTATEAFDRAVNFVGATKYKWQNPVEEAHIRKVYGKDTSYKPKGALMWIEDRRSGEKNRTLHLAWSFDIYAEQPLTRQVVYIDAANGKVLFSNELIHHTAATGASRYSGVVPITTSFITGDYYLFDSSRGDGVYTLSLNNGTSYGAATDYTSATNTWPTAPAENIAIDAHWGGEKVYDYFLSQHGRHSWDDLDGILTQYVHYSTNYNNAFWDGAEMTYGDGTGLAAGGFTPLTSLDVTAHEIGHGICQATCALIYESESGALNESFSDCWGATVEHWADPHEVDAMPKSAWDMGEEISTEPLRSMNSPLLQGQPDTYGGTNWFNVVGCTPSGGNDQCGVHNNSGLMNYWYYLLVEGGTGVNDNGNAYIVNGLDWTKASNVLYQTELSLASTADYADCRVASINAATLLYGACSAEVQSVTNAWYAVGVGAAFVPCTPQISFFTKEMHVSEAAPSTACPASRTVTVGLKSRGTIAGGNPIVNLVITGSTTALYGTDYTVSAPSVTFNAGDTSSRYFTFTIFDNGAVNDEKQIGLAFTVLPMGTGATVAPYNDSMTLYIHNDDSIPYTGNTRYSTANQGLSVTGDFSSPFFGKNRRARSQYIIYANELAAAGVVPKVPISQIAFNVLTKSSTAPFVGYTVSMANTSVTNLYTSFVTAGLTQVYTGNFTTWVGLDTIDFNTGTFTWDGSSNVVVQVCFGQNAAAFSANDKVSAVQQGEFNNGAYNSTNSGSGTGCSLGFNTSNRMVIRPVMRFKQAVPPSAIETTVASTHTWDVYSGSEVYFRSTADTQVIVGLKAPDHDLGCVTATVTQAGNGFAPAVFSAINRSRKEVQVTPTTSGGITTYELTFYMTTAELAGVSPSSLMLLKTTVPTDATVATYNSQVITPTIISAGNYTGFRATFTGFGRYMLVDGPLCNVPMATITAAGPTTFCSGSSVTLNAGTGAGYGYQWQLGGTDIPGATAASYAATLAGNYTVRVNQSVCDTTSDPIAVTVDPATLTAISGTPQVCEGQTTVLFHTTTGGAWSSSNVAVATVGTGGIVSGITAGTATITYTVINTCGTVYTTVVVTVNAPSPVAPITGAAAVCRGATSSLSDATAGGVWSSGNPAVANVSTAGVLTGINAGTAIVSYGYTNALGCTAWATTTATVNAVPAAATNPSGSYALCSGVSGTVNALPATGHSYQWQSGGIDIPGATSGTFVTGTPGIYRVIATNIYGCAGTSSDLNIFISTTATVTPSVSLSAVPGFAVCATGAAVTFTANPVHGGPIPSYDWTVNGTSVGGTGDTYAYVPTNGDVVACVLHSSDGCAVPPTATTSEMVTVNAMTAAAVSITAAPNDTVCVGDSVTYIAVPTAGGATPSFLWSVNGVNVATGPTYTAFPANGDLVRCYLNSSDPCALTTSAVSAPFVMRVMPHTVQSVVVATGATAFVPGAPVTFVALTSNSGSAPAFQWYIDGVAVTGATNSTFTTSSLLAGQMVSCKVSTSLLCSAPNVAVSNGVVLATGIDHVQPDGQSIVLAPNPSRGWFRIMGTIGTATESNVVVRNMLGQQVYTASWNDHGRVDGTVTLPADLANGMYVVQLTNGTAAETFFVTVEK